MKHFWAAAIFLFLMLLTANTGAETVQEAHRYRQAKGEEIFFFDWILDRRDLLELTAASDHDLHRSWNDENSETVRWELRVPEERTDVTARREGDEVVLEGAFRGEEIHRRFSLEGLPWYQAMSLSLRPFVLSEDPERHFWTLRPDNLQPVRLSAVRSGVETVSLGKPVESHKVEIRPAGIASLFWKGHYWFRTGDGLFLKYEGPGGPPGTPLTIITLSPPFSPSSP